MSSIVTRTVNAASSTATAGFSDASISLTSSSSVASSTPGISYSYQCPQTYHASTVVGAVFGGVALGMLITVVIGLFIAWRQKRLVWQNVCQCRSATTPSDSESRPASDGTLAEKTAGYTLEYGKALGYEKRLEYEKTVDFGRRGHESDDGATLQGSVLH